MADKPQKQAPGRTIYLNRIDCEFIESTAAAETRHPRDQLHLILKEWAQKVRGIAPPADEPVEDEAKAGA